MIDVHKFNTARELAEYLIGTRPAPCRTTSVPDPAASKVNQGPAQASGYAQTVQNVQKEIRPPAPPKPPTSISTVVTVEKPQKPKVKARNLGIGQAISLHTGNTVYRLGPDNYLVLTPYNVTLHHSAATLPDFEGEVLPLGSKITIRV